MSSSKTKLNFSYSRAARLAVALNPNDGIHLVLVGCGGTGSYMAMHIARIMRVMKDSGRRVMATFIDHDKVEEQNIGRQLFCDAELNQNKAEAVARRYSLAFGLEIRYLPERFKAGKWDSEGRGLCLIIGCVDNPNARKEINKTLAKSSRKNVWWLDCGNHEDSGQVLLGNITKPHELENSFLTEKICNALPSPGLVRPDLFFPRESEKQKTKLSCRELTALNLQSLQINNRIAGEAADMLTRFLITKDLRRFECELDLKAGVVRSRYITTEEIARFAICDAAKLVKNKSVE